MKKKIALFFETLLTIIIIGLCVLIVAISKGFHPSIGGYEMLRVLTPSMEPALHENSMIIIKHTAEENLKEGDIITFVSEDPAVMGFYVTHRIYMIVDEKDGSRTYITKGDANTSEDLYTVRYDDIAGKYVKTVPFSKVIGSFIAKLANNKIYFIFIILPIIIVLITYIWQLMSIVLFDEDTQDGKEDKEEKESGQEDNPEN